MRCREGERKKERNDGRKKLIQEREGGREKGRKDRKKKRNEG